MKKTCKNCNHFEHCVRVYNLYSCCNAYEAKPLTEQEWLQTATTEQLVEEIYGIVWCGNELWQRLYCREDGTDKEGDLKIVREWLKEIHHDGNT